MEVHESFVDIEVDLPWIATNEYERTSVRHWGYLWTLGKIVSGGAHMQVFECVVRQIVLIDLQRGIPIRPFPIRIVVKPAQSSIVAGE